jgi:hypothetical protein
MSADPSSLDRLHDVLGPSSTPWWPPAPAWYWLLGACALALLVLFVLGVRHWLRNRYRHEALAELAQWEPLLADTARRAAALAALAALLKRTAISAWPRETVASLTGAEWQVFLDRAGGADFFCEGGGALLELAAYDPRGAVEMKEGEIREIAAQVKHWLTQHRVVATETEAG